MDAETISSEPMVKREKDFELLIFMGSKIITDTPLKSVVAWFPSQSNAGSYNLKQTRQLLQTQ